MHAPIAWLLVGLLLVVSSACERRPDPAGDPPSSTTEPILMPATVPEDRETPIEPVVEPVVEPPTEPPTEPVVEPPTEPPAEPFDPATATAATVRIITIHSWGLGSCGIIHSTGAIEVEVLGVGEPAPRMILIVSCPTDFHRGTLMVDTIVDVTLHARRQSWPTPSIVRKLPPELPRRYVKSIKPTSPSTQ